MRHSKSTISGTAAGILFSFFHQVSAGEFAVGIRGGVLGIHWHKGRRKTV
jgi:hypothetical protein